MTNLVILIGEGPNRVEIPCMIFESFEQGIDYVNNALQGQPIERDVILTEGPLAGKRIVSWLTNFDDDWGLDSDEQVENRMWESFFTFHYGGCGDCYRLVLEEVAFATPFIGWDLD